MTFGVSGVNTQGSYSIGGSISNSNAQRNEQQEEQPQLNVQNAQAKQIDAKELGDYSSWIAAVNSVGINGGKEKVGFDPNYYAALVDKYNTPEQQKRIEAGMGELVGFTNAATDSFRELGFGDRSEALGLYAATKDVNNAQVVIEE